MRTDAHGNFSGRDLVIFGCGYVGTTVALGALARGMKVTALTRNTAQADLLRAQGIAVVVGDIAEKAWHEQIAGTPEYVLNCVSSGGGGLEGYRQSYVAGMSSVLTWATARGGVGTMVFTSSTSVYPQGEGQHVDESSATARATERGQLLLQAEDLLRAAGSAARRRFILRLAGIYGPGRHHVLDQVRSGTITGHGAHRLNLAHRDDIAAAVWACFGAPASVQNEIFNVADDAPTPKTEVAAWLATKLGVDAPRFTGEPLAARQAVTPDRMIDNAKLKNVLGWQPRFSSFREGYEKMLSP